MKKKTMNLKEAVSWLKQPGIKAMMPCDPHTQEAMKVLIAFAEKGIEEKKPEKKGSYKIYYSSAAGLDYVGITCSSEEEAKALCEKYNSQDDTPYGYHTYSKC